MKSRGILTVRVHLGLAGFGIPDKQGNWSGFDVDFCRAIAAAIFNDPTKVKFIPTTSQNRFTALQSGEVDVLDPQHDLDVGARHLARPQLHQHDLL